MVRMLNAGRAAHFEESRSSSGQRPSGESGERRETSTTSSATRPWPREISSRPSSLLPTPGFAGDQHAIPSTSMNTPCNVPVSASWRDR